MMAARPGVAWETAKLTGIEDITETFAASGLGAPPVSPSSPRLLSGATTGSGRRATWIVVGSTILSTLWAM